MFTFKAGLLTLLFSDYICIFTSLTRHTDIPHLMSLGGELF